MNQGVLQTTGFCKALVLSAVLIFSTGLQAQEPKHSPSAITTATRPHRPAARTTKSLEAAARATNESLVVPGSVRRTDLTNAFRLSSTDDVATILHWDQASIRAASVARKKVSITGFPLRRGLEVDLELEPFRIVSPNAKFMVRNKDGFDVPLAFDPQSISLFRGQVKDRPGSHVYMALGDLLSTGFVDLGAGAPRYELSSKGRLGQKLTAGHLSVFESVPTSNLPPNVPLCGVDGHRALKLEEFRMANASTTGPAVDAAAVVPTKGMKQLELAVDTDYDYFILFDNAMEATAYILVAYGAVSDFYMRDVNTRVEIVFTNIWETPNDQYNGSNPLGEFRSYWQANMGAIQRDTAQLFSGRRDFPFGGQAWLSALCSNFGYGVVGYVVGFLPDPSKPSPFNYDAIVTAHELGHNAGTGHTHDDSRLAPNFIDTCDDPTTAPQRGPIMSYCGQTWSGMNANHDNYFHRRLRPFIEAHVAASFCIATDCNQNSIDDAIDIAVNAALDNNNNGIIDACEDCDGDGILDPVEIAGASNDLNNNTIPDECEPDCNGNGIPDDRDIALNPALDAYGNGILDECETDCNNNSTSDYTEIQLDMSLDLDRNAVLDACQNCDGDAFTDHTELDSAHYVWVANGKSSEVLRKFFPSTGVLTATSSGGASSLVNQGQDLIVTPDSRVLVSSGADHRVMRFDLSGAYQGDLVSAGSGGVSFPTGLIISPSGDLLVCSRDTHSVLAYDATTGSPMGAFVAAASGGLAEPFGLTYGPNGNLFVTSATNEVIEYGGADGAFVRVFVSAIDNGGLDQPRGLTFKADGNLLVASFGSDEVLEFDGATGAPLGKWAQVGTATRITQDSPWGIRIGPNGHVFVSRTGTAFSSSPSSDSDEHSDDDNNLSDGRVESHLTDARMFEFHVCTGAFRRTHIGGNDHGLEFATGFDFIPGDSVDCNQNQIPDTCDVIDNGTSADINGDNIPDECQLDCNGNGKYDRLDLIPFGASYDCNCNFQPDECDISSGFSDDCDGNGVPDECEDCNGNGIGDACDINPGNLPDCNQNGILDECESITDCDGNGQNDICDLFLGTHDDCNGNGVPDPCDAAGGGLLLDANFESGLPAGWTTSGIFQVGGDCAIMPVCGGSQWAYAGNAAGCVYGNAQTGELTSPPIVLAQTINTLSFCSMVQTEEDFDFAEVLVNGQLVWQKSGLIAGWVEEEIDLGDFGGQTITITFRFTSDFSVIAFGWQVDNIRLVSGSPDCDSNDVPDECDPDCDLDGIPNACDNPLDCVCLSSTRPEPEMISADDSGALSTSVSNRYLSFVPGAANGGRERAVRVTLLDLPPAHRTSQGGSVPDAFAALVGAQMWVGPVSPLCTTPSVGFGEPCAATSTNTAALQCTPFFTDWGTFDVVHVWSPHNLIVPGAVYRIEILDAGCNPDLPSSYSPPLDLSNPAWGDVGGVFIPSEQSWTPPEGIASIATDTVALLGAFKGSANGTGKARSDLEGTDPNDRARLDGVINLGEVIRTIDAFKGLPYPFDPPAMPCTNPS